MARTSLRICVYASVMIMLTVCFFPDSAHAGYLDPGSGSTLVQGIIAVFAAVARFFRKIGSFFRRGGMV